MRKRRFTSVAVGLAALAVSATAGLASASGAQTAKSSGEPTLVIWDQNTVGNLNPIYNHLVSMFEAKYHVKVDRITKPFTQILQQQKLALSGPNPPAIVQSNQGYGAMGPEVQAHLIIPLTKYPREYHWANCQPSTILSGGDFTSNGKHFGSGPLYGISDTIGGPVAVYYNKTLLKRLGVSLPIADLSAFQSVLAKAKAAGMTPIEFGDLEQWPGIQEYQSLWDAYAPSASVLQNYVYGIGTETFKTPFAKQAANAMDAWVKDGYFNSGFNGLSYETAWEDFTKGHALFLISGPWLSGSISSAMGNNAGVMLMPEAKAGAPVLATNSGNNSYVIAAKATPQEQKLAAEYLNWLTCSKQASTYFVEQGQIPVYLPSSELHLVKPGSLLADWISVYDTIKSDNGSVMFMDLSTNDGTTLIGQLVQELTGNKISTNDFIQSVENDYSNFHRSL